jgi:MFS family permease
LGGATPIAIGGGVIGDVFAPHDRAAAMAVYSMGPLLGPVIGPVAGGFVAESIGFKWVFIIISSFAALVGVIGILLLQETYHPMIRARLIGDTELAISKEQQNMTKRQILWINLSRPIVLLSTSFILFILSLFMAL